MGRYTRGDELGPLSDDLMECLLGYLYQVLLLGVATVFLN